MDTWIILPTLTPSCVKQGGSGSASNIKFQNVEMHNVNNPIIIDQNYCDQDKPCNKQVNNFVSLPQAIQNKQYINLWTPWLTNYLLDLICIAALGGSGEKCALPEHSWD